MRVEVVTPPASEPVSLDEMKLHLKMDGISADDDLIAALVSAARERCETITRRAFLTTTFDVFLDWFPGYTPTYQLLRELGRGWGPSSQLAPGQYLGEVRLPRPPLQSVTFVKYVDPSGTLQTIDPADYRVTSAGTPGRVTPLFGRVWPPSQVISDAVNVRFVAGFGDDPSDVPASARAAVKLLAAHLYENRSDAGDVPAGVRALLASLKWGSYE